MGTVRFLNDDGKVGQQKGKHSSVPRSSIETQSDSIIYATSGTGFKENFLNYF